MGRPLSSENFNPTEEIPENSSEGVRRAVHAAMAAKAGALEAQKDYERVVGELDDIDTILAADRAAREERRQQAHAALEQQQLALDNLKRKRMEEQIALEETRQKLARTINGSETPSDEFAAKRRAMEEEKRSLRERMAKLQAEIKEIEDDKPQKKLHPDAQRFEEFADRIIKGRERNT